MSCTDHAEENTLNTPNSLSVHAKPDHLTESSNHQQPLTRPNQQPLEDKPDQCDDSSNLLNTVEQDDSDHRPLVAILIPTYQRPDSLESLLRTIDESVRQSEPSILENWKLRIFIADNDETGCEGYQRAAQLAEALVIELELITEPRPGVSYVRNRLVEAALQWQAYYLLLIDDDEWPSRNWITHMLDTAEHYSADIVSGPVRPHFEVTPPNWIIEHRLFDDAPLASGEFPNVQRTGNTLLRSERLKDHVLFPDKEWFLVSLGRVGGEDSHMIEGLVRNGARHVWCEEAVVHERIPAQRLSLDYLRNRAFRTGNAGMRYRSLLLPGLHWSCIRAGKSLFLLLRWLLLSHRLLFPEQSKIHTLDWQIICGRFNAHLGKFQQFY